MSDMTPVDAAAARITVYPDGPLVLRGDFAIYDVDGNQLETGRMVALCRCGRSALKPLCDGGHKNAGAARDNGKDAAEFSCDRQNT